MPARIAVVAGPTASGKSGAAVELALLKGGEVISADAFQVYRDLDIGTAKITENEMRGVPHHLIDVCGADEAFDVTEYQTLAAKAIEEVSLRGKLPIICGGSGFYIQSVLRGIDFTEAAPDEAYRKELYAFAKEQGNAALHRLLEEKDPEAAAAIHENNIKRVVRALEFNKATGKKISEHNAEQGAKGNAYDCSFFVMELPREVLYERIDRRVDEMVEQGLFEEVARLLGMGIKPDAPSMQAIGYKEAAAAVLGEVTREEAVERIKLGTRHYAKRQATWFKREKDTIAVDCIKYRDAAERAAFMAGIIDSRYS